MYLLQKAMPHEKNVGSCMGNLKAKIGNTKVVLQREGVNQLMLLLIPIFFSESQGTVPQPNHEELERVAFFLNNLEKSLGMCALTF